MAELMLFRRNANGQDVELPSSTMALEIELQRRVEAGLEQMLGIRFLASEYPTGPWHRGRIDTLGLDENGSPVVIEYKKGSDSGVLSQAVSYLSWLESAHHEVRARTQESTDLPTPQGADSPARRSYRSGEDARKGRERLIFAGLAARPSQAARKFHAAPGLRQSSSRL
ncbi:hypothetical protein ACGFZA_41435 [Streptomyces sp. NPDC048211]|uniref:hypothetical protein n=1 Tax=Streptomyces sp. NPDC048211 TaxID=3365516 RepID=UPI003718E0FF